MFFDLLGLLPSKSSDGLFNILYILKAFALQFKIVDKLVVTKCRKMVTIISGVGA